MSALIQIVDEQDQPVRTASKQEAWADGLWRRIVRIMIDDGKGNLLLQHRTPTKDIYPNCWDNSAAGHVDAGEDYETAAYRELAEELGMHGVRLQPLGSFRDVRSWHGLQMNTFVHVYVATKPDVSLESPEPDKIDEVRWFTIDDVKQMVLRKPSEVTDGLAQVITRYY